MNVLSQRVGSRFLMVLGGMGPLAGADFLAAEPQRSIDAASALAWAAHAHFEAEARPVGAPAR